MIRRAPSGSLHRWFGVAPRLRVFPGASCFTNPYYAGSFFCRRFYPPGGLSYGLPWLGPYSWNSPEEYQPVEEPPTSSLEQDNALSSQVDALADEVAALREEQAARNYTRPGPSAPPAAVQEQPATAILVYRDGHRDEVQNYAILRQTLWIFAGQTTRRVSLADLDLQATKRLNDERGVDFLPHDCP
jgi:hypothetical protein